MRVTAQTKQDTTRRILNAALEQFGADGFDAATTRAIAQAAGIATGTLFNYFATKEAIVAALADEVVAEAHRDVERLDAGESLQEDLFALVAAELRRLKPLRKFILPLLETELSPLTTANRQDNDGLQAAHLERVTQIARRHGFEELPATALHMYWALYTGALAFWAADQSPAQEDTLALLDQSLEMFAAWVRATEC